ncbi:hypothetical protein CVD25_20855 [Bacillus canaveralius]|uniref:DISARM protein DrmE C-terminal domain-containing protein n=1 Tax=Bacillus canaveralius TaxID=1403243 RepID=A0A2N5GJY5_9BACI|nr:DrmE family protein [Bacillus canaveralius]PLR81626.1 hypothetical protein CU635_14280 [Bacillus canaveralius]PLR89911.1 hypothetical protein CVD25_20855 [Bacillus canaveralius]
MLSDKIRKAYDRSFFLIDNKPIQKSDFISNVSETVIKLLTDSKKERGIILHPGTCLPLYVATIIASFKSFLSDDTEDMSFINELTIGDLVIYQNKRGKFKGTDNEGRIVIENCDRGTLTVNRVPFSLANTILPYFGTAKTLDGRGIRKTTKRQKVISTLFDIKNKDVNSITNKSVVIVCEKSEADGLMKRLKISVNKEAIEIGDLFPAGYYTNSDLHYYSGNPAKVEPLLKFTNKLSVARELIIEDKNIETLIISGSKYFSEDISELASIYNRNSLKSIVMLGELYKGIDLPVYNNFENLKKFVWINERLSSIGKDKENNGIKICEESKQLNKMIDNFINIKINVEDLDIIFNHGDFLECKKYLQHLIRYKSNNENITIFIIKAYWLLNLLEKSFFPLTTMERLILEGRINALSPTKALESIYNIANQFNNTTIGQKMFAISSILRRIKNEMDHRNPKYNFLIEFFKQIKHKKKKVSIVTAKTYYGKIFLHASPTALKGIIEKCEFYTHNNFNSHNLVDEVILTGVEDWNKMNPLFISNTKLVTFLLYPNEKKQLIQKEAQTKKQLCSLTENLDKTSMLDMNLSELEASMELTEESEEITIETELDTFTSQISFNFAVTEMKKLDSVGIQTSEIQRIAILETGEKVFFTKYYTPYVYSKDSQSVIESDVSSIVSGDLLVFTNYDSETKDIVEKIIQIILQSKNCDEVFRESYKKSLYWKQALKEFMTKNKLSFKQLSDKMKNDGKGKHEVTLRSWLDEESHIVGPRDRETYHLIAKITNDLKMLADPDSYYNSCREIRSMRTRILKYIGKNIIQTLNNSNELPHDDILSALPINVSNMSYVVQIEKMIDVENLVIPSHFANRPQNL